MKNMLDEAWGVCYYNTRFVGQAVKTPPSHGGNTGSIPVRTAKTKSSQYTVLRAFLFLQAINNYKTIGHKKLMPACKHDASAFLFLRWLKSLCLKYNNTCALQIIAQIVYSAGIDADNSWSKNVVLAVFYNSCLFTIAKLYN